MVKQVMKEYNVDLSKPIGLKDALRYGKAFDHIKHLNAQKQAFNNALDYLLPAKAKDKNIKEFLKKYDITGRDSYYKLLKQGKAEEVAKQLPALMPKGPVAPDGSTGNNSSGGSSGGLGAGTDKVIGSSKQTRNITIKFDSYIKGDVISQNNVIRNMNKDELLRFLAENFRRLMASIETQYGQ